MPSKNAEIILQMTERIRIQCCCISKISNSVGRNNNFLAKARKLSVLPTELDIFHIRQHYVHVRILFIFQRRSDLLSFIIRTPTNMNSAVYGNGLAVLMTS